MNYRLYRTQLETLQRAAKASGMSVGRFARRAALEAADRVIERKRRDRANSDSE
jgi:uncharacterized protein (DUF1778 family)